MGPFSVINAFSGVEDYTDDFDSRLNNPTTDGLEIAYGQTGVSIRNPNPGRFGINVRVTAKHPDESGNGLYSWEQVHQNRAITNGNWIQIGGELYGTYLYSGAGALREKNNNPDIPIGTVLWAELEDDGVTWTVDYQSGGEIFDGDEVSYTDNIFDYYNSVINLYEGSNLNIQYTSSITVLDGGFLQVLEGGVFNLLGILNITSTGDLIVSDNGDLYISTDGDLIFNGGNLFISSITTWNINSQLTLFGVGPFKIDVSDVTILGPSTWVIDTDVTFNFNGVFNSNKTFNLCGDLEWCYDFTTITSITTNQTLVDISTIRKPFIAIPINSAITIHGFRKYADNQKVTLINSGSSIATIPHLSSSTPTTRDRVYTPTAGSIAWGPNKTIELLDNLFLGYWILEGGTALNDPENYGTVTGDGTVNYLPKWDTTSEGLEDSIAYQSGTYIASTGFKAPSFVVTSGGIVGIGNDIATLTATSNPGVSVSTQFQVTDGAGLGFGTWSLFGDTTNSTFFVGVSGGQTSSRFATFAGGLTYYGESGTDAMGNIFKGGIASTVSSNNSVTAIASLTPSSGKIPEFTGSNTATLLDFDTDPTLSAGSNTAIPSQLAVQTYINNSISGLKFKVDVRVATTANITLSGTQTIDGVSLSVNDRVLVKNQTSGSQNGAYLVASGAWTRTTDADSATELISATFPVREGTTNQDTWWTCTNDSITLNTTSLVFTQTGGAGTYSADNSTLQLVGSQFSVKHVNLLALSSVSPAADKIFYFSGTTTGALTDFTSTARSLLDDTSLSAMRDTLGLGTANTPSFGGIIISGGSAAGPTLASATDSQTGLWFPATDAVGLATHGTDVVRWSFTNWQSSHPGMTIQNCQVPNIYLVTNTTSADTVGPALVFSGPSGDQWQFYMTASSKGFGFLNRRVGGTASNFGWGLYTDINNRVRIGNAPGSTGYVVPTLTHPLEVNLADAGTNAVGNVVAVSHNSTATPLAGFGAGVRFLLKSNTTADQDAGRIRHLWVVPTQGSQTSKAIWSVFNGSTEQDGIEMLATSTGAEANFLNGQVNGQKLQVISLTELTTVAAAATTDTTIQIPAGSIVFGVSVRVTTVIPTAATFTVIGASSSTAFNTAAVSTAANSTNSGTAAGAYYNGTAQSIRITPNLTPANNTGRVRVTIHYIAITPPTS